MEQDHIDNLLERYLYLLHEYSSLREELTMLQTGMYQNIARANFAAERGLRFGRDYYDDRMQATRRLVVNCESEGQGESRDGRDLTVHNGATPSFTVINPVTAAGVPSLTAKDSEVSVEAPDPDPHPKAKAEAEAESAEVATNTSTEEASDASIPSSQASIEPRPGEDTNKTTSESPGDSPTTAKKGRTTPQQKPNDPLRWFGLLTPVPLRQAQTQSIRVIEQVIPRLASVNAEMAEVEIEVRRARKRRAKAEAATIRLPQRDGQR